MRTNHPLLYVAGLALLAAGPACAQNSAWEGETGVFITPMAYTAPSTDNGLACPLSLFSTGVCPMRGLAE